MADQAEAIRNELRHWRREHPQASLSEIDTEVERCYRALLTETVEELATQDGGEPVTSLHSQLPLQRRGGKAITLAEIAIYPVKSLRGIKLEEAVAEFRGLRFDRRWLVVDANDRFLTQRTLPRMALIAPAVRDDRLELVAHGMPPLQVPTITDGMVRQVTIWRDTIPAFDAGEQAAAWLSEYLQTPCRLVEMPDSTQRAVNPAFSMPGDVVSFADGYPYMLIGQASLEDLNVRMATPLSMRRFRPNLVINGAEPFAEDSWKRVRIGHIVFRVAKSCERCIIPTVDPESGMFAGKEPLRTLATYRKVGSKVLFGRQLIAESTGTLRVGDPVEMLD